MRVLLIGGGATGFVITHFLLKEKEIDLIVVADINLEKIKKNIPRHRKVRFCKIDASRVEDIIKIGRKFDIETIINSALPYFNTPILKAAQRLGVNYLDFAGLWLKNKKRSPSDCPYKMEQLDFNEAFRGKQLVGLINAGVAPGLTNLLSGECLNYFEKINTIKIRLFENADAVVPFSAWSKEYTLDEIVFSPLAYDKKKFLIKENFSEEELYEFPEPIGRQKTYLLDQDEVITIPQYIKVKQVDVKSGGSEIELAKHLYNLGLFSKKAFRFGRSLITPYQMMSRIWPATPSPKEMIELVKTKKVRDAVFALSVEADGLRGNKREIIKYSVIFPSQKEIAKILPGATYISYSTGLMGAIFTSILPKIKKYGVFPPECLEAEARKLVLKKLSRYKINIKIQKIKI